MHIVPCCHVTRESAWLWLCIFCRGPHVYCTARIGIDKSCLQGVLGAQYELYKEHQSGASYKIPDGTELDVYQKVMIARSFSCQLPSGCRAEFVWNASKLQLPFWQLLHDTSGIVCRLPLSPAMLLSKHALAPLTTSRISDDALIVGARFLRLMKARLSSRPESAGQSQYVSQPRQPVPKQRYRAHSWHHTALAEVSPFAICISSGAGAQVGSALPCSAGTLSGC